MARRIYIIGSLRNPLIPTVANRLRVDGHSVFADWYGAGPQADDHWRDYENARDPQRSMIEALKAPAAQTIFKFDKKWLDWCDAAVLVMPAGKSGHLEFGYCLGCGKDGFVLFDGEPERWDVMYNFATDLFTDLEELNSQLYHNDDGRIPYTRHQ